jgi:glycosyltransferase
MPPHPTFYVRRSIYERLGAFDTSFTIAADFDCMLRFLGPGRVAPAYIPSVLVKMRLGGVSNRSIGQIIHKMREDYRALRRNQVGGVGALAWKNLSKVRQFFE